MSPSKNFESKDVDVVMGIPLPPQNILDIPKGLAVLPSALWLTKLVPFLENSDFEKLILNKHIIDTTKQLLSDRKYSKPKTIEELEQFFKELEESNRKSQITKFDSFYIAEKLTNAHIQKIADNFISLTNIVLKNCINVTDLIPLKSCKNLEMAEIYNMKSLDLSPLALCPNLTTLILQKHNPNNNEKFLEPFRNHPKLTDVLLFDTYFTGLSPLASCPNFTTLTLNECATTNTLFLEPFKGHQKFNTIQIFDMKTVCYLEPLLSCLKLTEVSVEKCKLDRASNVKLKELKKLLPDAKISDTEGIQLEPRIKTIIRRDKPEESSSAREDAKEARVKKKCACIVM